MRIALVLQVLGIIILSAGLFVLAPWAGLVGLGALTLALGTALELGSRTHGAG